MPLEIVGQCKKCSKRVVGIITLESDQEFSCPDCGSSAFAVRHIAGYLYILSNPEMPGLLKIGLTTRLVNERVVELNSATGVPRPFKVEAYFESADPKSHEGSLHEQFAAYRVPGREFFRMSLDEVIKAAGSVTKSEPLGVAKKVEKVPPLPSKARSWTSSVEVGWRCDKCANEFVSNTGLCPRCGGSAHRYLWG